MGQDVTSKSFSVAAQHAIADPQVLRLLSNMHQEVQAGCPSGKIYGEALSVALASYLLAQYSQTGAAKMRSGAGFSAAQAARLRDYIQVNLHRDTTLGELADLVGLSPHYFSLLFKNTFFLGSRRREIGSPRRSASRCFDCRSAARLSAPSIGILGLPSGKRPY